MRCPEPQVRTDKENKVPRKRPFLVLPVLQSATMTTYEDSAPDTLRPATATLERPQLLDLRLLNKLDMSLVRKEFLCITNLCRLPIETGSLSPTVTVRKNSPRSPLLLPLKNTKRTRRPSNTTTDKESSEDSVIDEENKSSRRRPRKISKISKPTPKQYNKPLTCTIRSHDTKSAVKPLRAVRSAAPPQITKSPDTTKRLHSNPSTSRLPQPCTTCGRPEQPERFHSHPPPQPAVPNSSTVTKKLTSPVKSTVHKPAPIRFKSKKQEAQKKATKTNSDEKSNKPIDNSRKEPEKKTEEMASSKVMQKGPRTLTCYICAREFGTASLPLHEPKCMQRWERENSELPRHLRRKPPIRPSANQAHSPTHWNQQAWEASQASLAPCLNCGRTFLPDRLIVHQRSCRPGAARVNFPQIVMEASSASSSPPYSPGPPTVRCYICHRMFGTKSIAIHEPQCLKKWHLQNDQLPPGQRLPAPIKPLPETPTHQKATSPGSSAQQTSDEDAAPGSSDKPTPPKKPTLPCYICGREFGVSSIYIHEPQCLKKWKAENDRRPLGQRLPEPQRPDIKFTPSGGVDFIGTFHRIWENHLSELVACRICGRRFFPDRIEKHEKACNNLPVKTKKK